MYYDDGSAQAQYEAGLHAEHDMAMQEAASAQAEYEAEHNQPVPCFRCSTAMHQESDKPEENICRDCLLPQAA